MARESMEAIERLFARFDKDLGQLSAKAKTAVIDELGSMRVSVPSLKTIEQMNRRRRICLEFKGNNILELSERFSMSPMGIRKALAAQK